MQPLSTSPILLCALAVGVQPSPEGEGPYLVRLLWIRVSLAEGAFARVFGNLCLRRSVAERIVNCPIPKFPTLIFLALVLQLPG